MKKGGAPQEILAGWAYPVGGTYGILTPSRSNDYLGSSLPVPGKQDYPSSLLRSGRAPLKRLLIVSLHNDNEAPSPPFLIWVEDD